MIPVAAAWGLAKTAGPALWRYKWQIALAAVAIYAGIEHVRRVGLQRDIATAKVKAHEAIAAQQLKADNLADRLLQAQAPVLAAVTEKEIVYVDRIMSAPETPADVACADSGAMRESGRAVHELFGPAGAGADGAETGRRTPR